MQEIRVESLEKLETEEGWMWLSASAGLLLVDLPQFEPSPQGDNLCRS
jgi:hypothetical protein